MARADPSARDRRFGARCSELQSKKGSQLARYSAAASRGHEVAPESSRLLFRAWEACKV